jgi:hypothetical protein
MAGEQGRMPKGRPRSRLGRAGVALGLAVLLLGSCACRSWLDIDAVRGGAPIYESTSPEGTHTVRFYRLAGAFVSTRVRAEVVYNRTGWSRNILYARTADLHGRITYDKGLWITWEGEDVAVIFGRRLDVRTDSYDFRHD